jgi:hypothetical protein
MSRWGSWIAVLGSLLVSSSIFAQAHAPKLIDVHVYYNGERGFLEKLPSDFSYAITNNPMRWFCK